MFTSKKVMFNSLIVHTIENYYLSNAFLVPKFSINLGQLCDLKLDIHFSHHGYYVQIHG